MNDATINSETDQIKITTWNIYWLGDRQGKIVRAPQHEGSIAKVISNISPDVLALQEIVDPIVMERILQQANGSGRNYVIRSDHDTWFTSDSSPTNSDGQKVFLCINQETIDFVRGFSIDNGSSGYGFRKPYAALLEHRKSKQRFVAVNVHLRAGYPDFLDIKDAEKRRAEAKAIANWLKGQTGSGNSTFPELKDDKIVVLGDFNAEYNSPDQVQFKDPNRSLDPLRDAIPQWTWNYPEKDGERWETAVYNGDRLVIDYILLSPSMAEKIAVPPKIYAWDCDAQLGGPAAFHIQDDCSSDLRGYEVSDHRPVSVVLSF